jgi:hypothetical protein
MAVARQGPGGDASGDRTDAKSRPMAVKGDQVAVTFGSNAFVRRLPKPIGGGVGRLGCVNP